MSLTEACLDAEAKNIALRKQLMALTGAEGAAPSTKNDETEGKLRAIELMKNELALKQTVESKELAVKRLQEEIKAHKMDIRKVHEDIQEARNVGQAPWEVTGFGTIEYRDPFPTGLSKRTPTGALQPRPPEASRFCGHLGRSRPPRSAAHAAPLVVVRRRLLHVVSSTRRWSGRGRAHVHGMCMWGRCGLFGRASWCWCAEWAES